MINRQITLYLRADKGLSVLTAIMSRFGPEVIRAIVGARGHNEVDGHFEAIGELASEHHIPFQPRAEATEPPAEDLCLAAGWHWLIPGAGADRLVVIHDSLLPRYRGFAPLVSCLINGEPHIGTTALLASHRYDEGDILAQESVTITYPIKILQAQRLLLPGYALLAKKVVGDFLAGKALRGRPQNHAQATYSLWRDDEDYRIDWTRNASWIRRMIDATGTPYQGASTLVDGMPARVLDAVEYPDRRVENRVPGKVLFIERERPVVVCGRGLLRVDRLVDDTTRDSLLPLTRLRTRFQ